MDRFIHGKPLLMLEIPQVVYRRDVYTATSFANIRKKVSPQVLLEYQMCVDLVVSVSPTDQAESERATRYCCRAEDSSEDTRLS